MSGSNEKLIDKLTWKNYGYIILIAILCIILCTYDLAWVIPSIIIMVIIILYSFWDNTKKKFTILNHIEEMNSDVDSVTKSNLINSPLPMILMGTEGDIIWKSKKFVTEFQNIDMRSYLSQMIKEIKLDLEKDSTKEISKQINIDKKIYKVKGRVVRTKRRGNKNQEYVLNLYFIDDTKYNDLFDEANGSKICIGMVEIDNYDDLIQRALPEEKIELLGNIEKEIIDWITGIGGLVIKTERDSFTIIFEQRYLADFEKDRFSILDSIKKIKTSNDVQITLSISVTNEGNTNYEKYKNALSGMEIVLGRGGDQAVVRKDGKYTFFGGTSLEIEKRTKVKARTIAQSISKIIKEADNVFIMGHSNIDIDSFGSALGVLKLAKTSGVSGYIVSEPKGKNLGKFYDEVKESDEYKELIITKGDAEELITDDSVLFVVDTHKTNYVEFPELLEKFDKIVVIDHHRKSPEAIENPLLSFHEVYASSAAELVTEIIQYYPDPVELNLIEAEGLYGGIMVDTKDFTFKTGVRTFEAAAYLRKYGVDIIRVKKWFQTDLESYKTIAEIINEAEIIEGNIAISTYKGEDENANLICARAADELLTISDISASFVMAKMDNTVFISGRSVGNINVQIILEKLGGGGHITLAGAQLEGLTLEEAHDELIIRINEYLLETK
ncbi:MAG: DHH family phosphoesterase [Clostridia bacterium]|nr:DHH family phosphoesterase [Clostridia bacterium]